jgi:hypothetical protein
MRIKEKNRLQSVAVSFFRFSFFSLGGKTGTGTDPGEPKTELVVAKKPVPVRLHDRFFPVAATGLQNTSQKLPNQWQQQLDTSSLLQYPHLHSSQLSQKASCWVDVVHRHHPCNSNVRSLRNKTEYSRSDNSRGPSTKVKVSEVYMHIFGIFGIDPARPTKHTFLVFTHMSLCKTLDDGILIQFLLSRNVLCRK